MTRRTPLVLGLLVGLLLMAFTSQTAHAQNSLVWDASGERNGLIMESTYTENYFGNGLVDQRIEVRVWNAPPNTRLKIFVRNTAIGVMQTNADGFGKFFKGRRDVPVGNDGRPDAPRVEDDDLLRVGRMKSDRFITGNFQSR